MKRFAVVAAALLGGGLWLAAEPAKPAADADLEQLLKKATVNGKYQMLIAQFKVEDSPEKKNGVDFKDIGLQPGPVYGSQSNVPKGYWVYAKPYLYVWRETKTIAASRQKRAWGPEQATGEPDTNMAGDIQTAWASQSQDDLDEWLMPEYAEPVVPTAVLIHETYNPGAVVRVTAFKLDGTEVELWKGQDPTGADNDMGVSEIPVKVDFKTNRLKISIASRDVPGWNEIDAIGLRDKDGKMHWATAVDASTTYAPPFDAIPRPAPPAVVNVYETRIRKLEQEITELKAVVEMLKQKVEKKDK